MEDQQGIVEELRQIKLIMLDIVTKELSTKTEKMLKFAQYGVGYREIAKILDTTPNTVAVALSQQKAKGKKGG